MKIAAYCRIGNIDSVEPNEVVRYHKGFVKEYVKEKNLHGRLKFYIDAGFSAINLNRPQLNNLIKDIENRKIDAILVKNIEQLFRKHVEYLNFYKNIIKPYNLKIICMDYDFDDDEEQMIFSMIKTINELKTRDELNKWKMRKK